MQLSVLFLQLLALGVAALPTATSERDIAPAEIAKRATITDVPGGYASLNGGTTGGKGGTTTTVSTYAQFTAAVTSDSAKVVIVSGTITQTADQVKVGSNTSIIGKNSSAKLVGFGLLVKSKTNVIIRNLTIQKVLADNGDAIGVQLSTNVWIDHADLSSDRDHDKDYYDGLLDLTHAADYITVSNTFFHDHWKASLVGHSDSNSAEDTGHLRVTYNNNYWYNINSRTPSIRFGTGHIYNSYFLDVADGINTRDGAQVLVQSNVWAGTVSKPLYSTDSGYAVASDNDFGGESNEALAGTLTTVPYSYTLLGSSNVYAAVYGTAGATLSF
ncbi:probable pectate lyase B precursor [Phialocephala subalpina]|uniref:pectate lyase n=1 Tax=Phialocephala subalpina TaxID=576137 RepID=A0A1L7X0E4_9HELO|nr:probable pectate lyase B precursor [Phialocephala subalpina]